MNKIYDIIVIGGGHAGVEAAYSASKIVSSILLITNNIDTIGQMSCNPSIGGIGKSQIVREISSLGGIMPYAADCSAIHFKKLNIKKGRAVQSTRAQIDRDLYKSNVKKLLFNKKNIHIMQDFVIDIKIKEKRIHSVITKISGEFITKTIILCAGTFLNGLIHIGKQTISAGRAGDASSTILANKLKHLSCNINRLKTGTPPRIDKRTINFDSLLEEKSEVCKETSFKDDYFFSFFDYHDFHRKRKKQISCFITRTTQETFDIINNNLNKSSMYSGDIKSKGPRYCPSIEDKIVKFPQRKTHQLFIEPEGIDNIEIYPNGISTSFPFDIQKKIINSVIGFEKSIITRPGYAIEYDFFDPKFLKPTLESKLLNGLYLAGQINGTTGYEEAAAQGLIAGINASLSIKNDTYWIPKRNESYIGVMINDLINHGVIEPYRMFTSRAEYRISLREDNADKRLYKYAFNLNLIRKDHFQQVLEEEKNILFEYNNLKKNYLSQNIIKKHYLCLYNNTNKNDNISFFKFIQRPEVTFKEILEKNIYKTNNYLSKKIINNIETMVKYSGYLEKQKLEIEKNTKFNNITLPKDINYKKIYGLSSEIKEILSFKRPNTIEEMKNIPGITPVSISNILIFLKKNKFIS